MIGERDLPETVGEAQGSRAATQLCRCVVRCCHSPIFPDCGERMGRFEGPARKTEQAVISICVTRSRIATSAAVRRSCGQAGLSEPE